MIDKKLWSEATDIAKDQLRHGKVHYSDFQKVAKAIYMDLLQMEEGPVIDIAPLEQKAPQQALPPSPESKFKHEIVNGDVRCAECGKLFKSLSSNHIHTHNNMTRQEYMAKHKVIDKDMQGTISRSPRTGEDNALTIMSYIMKEYELKRAEVKPFVQKHGFKDIKDLMAQAKDKGSSALNLLKDKVPASKKNEK